MEVVERRVAVWWVGQQVAKSVEQLRASLFPYIPTFSCRYTHVIQERVKMGRKHVKRLPLEENGKKWSHFHVLPLLYYTI